MELADRLRETAERLPSPPSGDAAGTFRRGRRRRQRRRAGIAVAATVGVVAIAAVGVPLLPTAGSPSLEIADRPDRDPATDAPLDDGFTLGESYVWRSEPGSPDDAGLAFASEVLGWDDASIIDRTGNIDQAGNLVGDPADQRVWLTMVNAADRTVELHLVRSVSTPEAWEVNQVAAGTDVALRMTEEPSLVWRPQELDTELHRPFEGTTGVAYVRTLERGTVTIELDQTVIANARVPLDGNIELGEPFCHNIQTALLLFHDDAGEVVSAVGGVWYGDDPPDCDLSTQPTSSTSAASEHAPDAGSDASHWPVELRYFRGGDERYLLRFRGTSWEDWSVEVREPDGSWRLVDREHPGEDFETEGGAFLDEAVTADPDEFTRAPGPELIPVWRDTTGLGERVVVELGEIPGADELIERLGLGADEIEAYVSPNVLGCDEPLPNCIPQGETGARGIAHLPTGFPLYAEEGSTEDSGVWLEAKAIRWADPAITPVPVEDVPRM